MPRTNYRTYSTIPKKYKKKKSPKSKKKKNGNKKKKTKCKKKMFTKLVRVM